VRERERERERESDCYKIESWCKEGIFSLSKPSLYPSTFN